MELIHGGDIYSQKVSLDFSANLNPLGMPDAVRMAAIDAVKRSDCYPDPRCRELRKAVSIREQIPEEQIIFGCGAAELIFALVQALRPKHALLAVPSFAEYESALESWGTQIEYHDLKEENGFRLQESFVDHIREMQRRGCPPDIVFLCNPNNPTGLPVEAGLLERIIRVCSEMHIRIVVDECFNGLWTEGAEGSVKRLIPEIPELFILRAFTKLYAMAGLRLGYGLTSDPELPGRLSRVVQPWSISVPAQAAGTAAAQLTGCEDRTRAYVEVELAFLKSHFQQLGLQYWESEVNYLFFKGPADLKEKLLKKSILIRSCSNYRGLGEGYFRIAVRTHEENEQLLKALEEVL